MAKQEIRVIQFPLYKCQALFVRGSDIDKVVIGLSPKTAANWRAAKIGPEFFMIGGKPYYEIKTLLEFFTQNPVKTTGDLIWPEREKKAS